MVEAEVVEAEVVEAEALRAEAIKNLLLPHPWSYHNSVNSHILYGILVWGSTNHSILQPLQVLENKVLRIICNVSKNEHVKNNSL